LGLAIAASPGNADMGAFSVSQSQLKTVVQYVERQEEHHRNRTFQKEYRELLRLNAVEFDEQYIWD